MRERTTYTIVIRPEADCREEEAIRGLRWVLKLLLRRYGLRCISVSESGSEKTHMVE